MSQGSGFIAAAAAALVVSVGAAGFLAARRSHTSEAVPFSPVASDSAAASQASPLTPPVVQSPVTEPAPATESAPAKKTQESAATPAKTRAPKPAAPRTVPPRESRPARPAPSLPASEPVIAAPPQLPPPVTTPAFDPPSPPPPAVAAEPPPVEVQKPRFEELTVKADSVVGIKLEQSLSSATARIEERVTALVSRDVTVDGRTVLPIGTKLEGTVMLVEPGSKFKGRARLGIRFHTIVLADGQKVPIQTEALYREGESATGSTATKVGTGAAAGAILGAVIGGKRGAIIGAGVGAGGGTAAVMAGNPKEALLPSGTPLTMRLTNPVTITIERDQTNR